ncbi:MAG: hypothetical protein ACREBG_08695 [Pyrinomonadaceae bacterium]
MRSGYGPLLWAIVIGASLLAACASNQPGTSTANTGASSPDLPYATAPLPDNGYKAKITLANPPGKMRAGQKEIIQVKVRNASDVPWKVRGGGEDNKFYIAAGNLWLEANGEKLLTKMDGRHGLPKNLNPGEEVEVPLQITAPKDLGEYILEVDLVQEQVAWFKDKGSPTIKVKVSVVK